MMRRAFLKTGVGGTAAALAQGVATPANRPASGGDAVDPGIVVIGADGSVPSSTIVDKYLRAGADVWHFLPSLPELSKNLEFLDRESSKITLAKSYADILAAKRAGKVAMVIGWQNSRRLKKRQATIGDIVFRRAPSFAPFTSWASGPPTFATTWPIPSAAVALTPRCP